MRPRLLDLYACEGGAGMGYSLAGFDVTAVDIDADALRSNPFPSVVCDALEYLQDHGREFDAIHASPPCQAFTTMSNKHRGKGTRADDWPDLLGVTRLSLTALGKPWVMENVAGARAHLSNPLTLHGGMFGLSVHRPRLFESNVLLMSPTGPRVQNPVPVYGKLDGALVWRRKDGSELRRPRLLKDAQDAMQMPWATWRGCCEAIPPAYTQYIGEQLLAAVDAAA